jgi:integrase
MQLDQQGTAKPRAGRPRKGHVYWHRDHWDIRIRLDNGKRGKPQHLDPKVTEEQARDLAAQASERVLNENKAPTAVTAPPSHETANEWLERWTADRRARGIMMADEYVGRWNVWIAPIFGHLAMRSVTREDVERVVDRLDEAVRAGQIRAKTAIDRWSIVKSAFRDAKSSKNRSLRVRTDNPTDGVQGPDGGLQRSKPWLYPCEFSALMACEQVPVRWRRLYALTTFLYLRAAEVAALTLEDVDLVGGVVLVHRSARRIGRHGASFGEGTKPTKTSVTHRVPIEPNLRPLLAVMIEEARAEGRTRLVKMPAYCDLPDDLRKHLPRAGITRAELFVRDETRAPLTFHDLRATGITWRAVRGDDVLKIQRAVGHLSLATTQRYIREAEVIGRDIGEPFPPLPAAILATDLTTLETPDSGSPSKIEESRILSIASTALGGR